MSDSDDQHTAGGDEPSDETTNDETTPEMTNPQFPSETPETVKQKTVAYRNRLQEFGVEIAQINAQYNTPEDNSNNESEDEIEEVLESIILNCSYNQARFIVVVPINDPFVLFQSDYDVVEEMIYASEHEHLGGDFKPIEPPKRWDAYQTARQQLRPEQIISLLQNNRSVPLPTMDAWLALLSTTSEKFTVDFTRTNFEYVGGIVQRRLYTPPTELATQTLYETVTQLISIGQALHDIIGAAYVLDGVAVPDDFEEIQPALEENEQTQEPDTPIHNTAFH